MSLRCCFAVQCICRAKSWEQDSIIRIGHSNELDSRAVRVFKARLKRQDDRQIGGNKSTFGDSHCYLVKLQKRDKGMAIYDQWGINKMLSGQHAALNATVWTCLGFDPGWRTRDNGLQASAKLHHSVPAVDFQVSEALCDHILCAHGERHH
eukprot:386615-Prymnesium_polylepis.2